MTSQPEFPVTVTITAAPITDRWGVARFEGVPSGNRTADGGGYKVPPHSPEPGHSFNQSSMRH